MQLSHIIPKWAYSWHKGEGGVRHSPSYTKQTFQLQDGHKHYLLCFDCEQFLGEAENYLRKFSVFQPSSLVSIGLEVRAIDISKYELLGTKRSMIQRALFGIALKTHYAPSNTHRIYSERAVQRLRESILADDYPVFSEPFGVKWYNGTIGNANPRAYCGAGLIRYRNGAAIGAIHLGGVDWYIQLEDNCRNELLYPWMVTLNSVEYRQSWNPSWQYFESEIPHDVWAVSSDDSCPCGSLKEYRKCCKNGWLKFFANNSTQTHEQLRRASQVD